MKINIEKTIEFFDDTKYHGHATSIVGLIGEDLNAWVFKYFMEKEKNAYVEILSDSVTTGQKKGKWLDRWIYVKENEKETLYQCEIKNWSSTAIGGQKLSLNANLEKKQEVARYYWKQQKGKSFSDPKFPNGVTKVLLENMKPPQKYGNIEIKPLIIYWMPISDTDKLNPLFRVAISSFNNPKIKTSFKDLDIFSVSLYLREFKDNIIDINNADIPNIKRRLEVLNDIVF